MPEAPTYTIIGTPFSTYTRSITLGLTYKGVSFDQVRVLPHSEEAYKHHPFGFLPTLVIRREGKEVKLRESQAIARYIDRVHPEPSLTLNGEDDGVDLSERVWEFASLAGSQGFPAVELRVVKPHLTSTDAGLLPSDITAATSPGLPALHQFLARIEALMVPSRDAYVFGDKVTWADFFLFPLLADLRAIEEALPTEEGNRVLSERLRAWMRRMDQLEAVQKTKEGTLSVGARPP